MFTEYRATQKWLYDLLAREGFAEEGRLEMIYGGMAKDQREPIKAAFQTHPNQSRGAHPAGYRCSIRRRQPAKPLFPADPYRDSVEPQPHGAAQRSRGSPWPEG